jgi:hypothetical protein
MIGLVATKVGRSGAGSYMETGTVKLPEVLMNMSWLVMLMGLFVSCQDLGNTKGRPVTISVI